MNVQRAIARAKRIEEAIRDRAFLQVPENINGVSVKQFTLRHATILTEIRSPFMVGGNVWGEDVATFLWVVSHQYSPQPEVFIPQNRLKRWWWKVAGIKPPTVREVFMAELVLRPRWPLFYVGIEKYLKRVWMDKPPEIEGGKVITASYPAAIVHRIAKALGLGNPSPGTPVFDAIMDTPLAAIFQLIKWIDVEGDPKAPQFTPLQSRVIQTAERLRERKQLRHGG